MSRRMDVEVPASSEVDATSNPLRQIFHEGHCVFAIATAYEPKWHELGVSVDCGPGSKDRPPPRVHARAVFRFRSPWGRPALLGVCGVCYTSRRSRPLEPHLPESVVTRFAPSPTGFLHVGGARTALF